MMNRLIPRLSRSWSFKRFLQTSTSHSNVMQGSLYNKTSAGQLDAHECTFNALQSALKRVSKLPGPIIEVQDLGCSAGFNALEYAKIVLKQLRGECMEKRPIRYAFVDLPTNDWPSLIKILSKNPLFCETTNNIYNMSGRDFYSLCAPPCSVHLSISLICLHWLSSSVPPTSADDITNTPFIHSQEVGVPVTIRNGWAEKAHYDMKLFLKKREEELVEGGEAIYLMVGGSDSDENLLHHQEWMHYGKGISTSSLTEAFQRAAQKGLITNDAACKAFVPYYLRTNAEIRRAVEDVPGLELLEINSKVVNVCEGTGKASGAMSDLAWSIHSAALKSTSGCSDEEMTAVRQEFDTVMNERFQENQGAKITYTMIALRKKLK